MKFTTFPFGTLSDGTEVTAARIENSSGSSLTVLDYGAAIQSLCVPDKDGILRDVILGYDTAAEYESNDAYLGATIGRVGNRIGCARFSLNGTEYKVAKNDGANHLHGGIKGFDKCIWSIADGDGSIVCERVSADGEEGYPGELSVKVTFTLTDDNALKITYDADTGSDTPVNMTNHSYFNLDGSSDILEHRIQIFADRFCEGDAGCLPTGRLLDVTGTPFDLREEKAVGDGIADDNEQLKLAGGYDHNYCLSGPQAAILSSKKSGIAVTVTTDLPGMQFYTGNFLTERAGKSGSTFGRRGGLCLETQLYPDGMSHYGFPSPILHAGEHLHSETVYKFSLINNS